MDERPILSELERLAELRDKGILSEQEFEEQKARYLAAPMPVARPAIDEDQRRNNAFLIELLGGLLGFLGLGYIYVGRTSDGLIRLVGWWIVIATMWSAVAALTAVVIGICLWVPAVLVQLGVPVLSANQLKIELDSGGGPA